MPEKSGRQEAVNLLLHMRVVKRNLQNLHQTDAFLEISAFETPRFASLACSHAQFETHPQFSVHSAPICKSRRITSPIRHAEDESYLAQNEAMTDNVSTCKANEDIDRVMTLMAEEQVRRIPIVDERGDLVGIVSQADIVLERGKESRKKSRADFTTLRKTRSLICRVAVPCVGCRPWRLH
jgi:hypothetical protein